MAIEAIVLVEILDAAHMSRFSLLKPVQRHACDRMQGEGSDSRRV